MRIAFKFLVVVAVSLAATGAWAWHANGYVYCDTNQNGVIDSGDLPVANAVVEFVNAGGTYTTSGSTGDDGYYYVTLPDTPDTWILTIDAASIPSDAVYVEPPSGQFLESTSDADQVLYNEWLIDSQLCKPAAGKCWMTGGGTVLDTITGMFLAQKGKDHSFGGNVNPSCSAEPGDGGSWNHVAHTLKLHFHGQSIRVVRCGNVDGIPPGSTSPSTAFNFIEFTGTGTLKGIKGNKADFGTVYFFARVEDRNEPGSKGNNDGAAIDRYYINVYTDPSKPKATSKILVDIDRNADTIDPSPITTGNLQLHTTSCK